MTMIARNTALGVKHAAHAMMHKGGGVANGALAIGLGFGVAQYSLDVFSDGKLGGNDVVGNILLAGGLGAGALLGARTLPAMFREAPRMAKLVTAGALTGAALLGAAPLAMADVAPDSPNLQSKALGVPTPVPAPVRSPGTTAAPKQRPEIEDRRQIAGSNGKTPNFDERRGVFAGSPNFIMLHGTGGGDHPGESIGKTAASYTESFTNTARPTSAHYVVDQQGNIARYVDPTKRAWHAAGEGDTDWNSAAVGIEMINDNTGKDPYTPEQLEATRALVQQLSHDFQIPPEHVYAHRQVQGNRRDPVGFPFREFINTLDDTEPMAGRVPSLTTIDQPNEGHDNPGVGTEGNPAPPKADPAPETTPAPDSTAPAEPKPDEIPKNDSKPDEKPKDAPMPEPTTPAVPRGPQVPGEPGAVIVTPPPQEPTTPAPEPTSETKPESKPAPESKPEPKQAPESGSGHESDESNGAPQESHPAPDTGNVFRWFAGIFG